MVKTSETEKTSHASAKRQFLASLLGEKTRLGRIKEFLARHGHLFLLSVFVAGFTHSVLIFLTPHLIIATAYDRLKKTVPDALEQSNGAVLLVGASQAGAAASSSVLATAQPPNGNTDLRFDREPAAFFTVCRYDLSENALAISVTLGTDSLLSITFHDALGNSYQAMTDEGLTQDRLDIVVSRQNGDTNALDAETQDDIPHVLHITSPTTEGFVLFQSMPKRALARGDAAAVAQSISCTKTKP